MPKSTRMKFFLCLQLNTLRSVLILILAIGNIFFFRTTHGMYSVLYVFFQKFCTHFLNITVILRIATIIKHSNLLSKMLFENFWPNFQSNFNSMFTV